MEAVLRTLVAHPWVEALGSVPFLAAMSVLTGLQAVRPPDDAVWMRRLARASWILGSIFVVLMAARFALLAS